MKLFSITTIVAAALISFTSCNKQYDSQTSDSTTPTNGSGGGGFGWTGKAPLSVKLNDTAYTPETVSFSEGGGYTGITFGNAAIWGFTLLVPTSATSGQVVISPSPSGTMTAINAPINLVLAGYGKIKVVTNNADVFEGYFYANFKDATNPAGPAASTIISAKEGYFKVNKH